LNTKRMVFLIVGIVLIVVALILGGIQVSHAYNLYGASAHKWYFYGGVAVVGVIGIVLVIWGAVMKETPKQAKPAA